jgi:hypothetical protein
MRWDAISQIAALLKSDRAGRPLADLQVAAVYQTSQDRAGTVCYRARCAWECSGRRPLTLRGCPDRRLSRETRRAECACLRQSWLDRAIRSIPPDIAVRRFQNLRGQAAAGSCPVGEGKMAQLLGCSQSRGGIDCCSELCTTPHLNPFGHFFEVTRRLACPWNSDALFIRSSSRSIKRSNSSRGTAPLRTMPLM